MKHTIADVKRMAGHLLSDPKRHYARWFAVNARGEKVVVGDKTSCGWCYWGAIFASADALGVQRFGEDSMPPGLNVAPTSWDNASTAERLEMARKLREAT